MNVRMQLCLRRDSGVDRYCIPGVSAWSGQNARYRLEAAEPDATAPAVVRALVAAGADVVQIYTGLIYKGPELVTEVASALQQMKR